MVAAEDVYKLSCAESDAAKESNRQISALAIPDILSGFSQCRHITHLPLCHHEVAAYCNCGRPVQAMIRNAPVLRLQSP